MPLICKRVSNVFLGLMSPLPTCMHPLPLPSRMPICGITSRPRIVLRTFKHVTKKRNTEAFQFPLEEYYAQWVEDKLMGKKRKQGPVPVPSREDVFADFTMSPLQLFGPRLPKACLEWSIFLMGSCILQGPTCKAISFPRIWSCLSPNRTCNCSAWCIIARRVSKPNICRLRILHCLCQHGCDPEIFMFPRLSCVCMHLGMWAKVKVHSCHAHAHVCASSCMCCAQATPLSQLKWV